MSDPTPPFPPPGARPPEEPPPPGARPPAPYPPAPGAFAPYPGPPAFTGFAGAAHRPGAIPLRPLTLGSMYDGAFRVIRYNPKATVGAAALVTAVAMALPVVVTLVVALTVGTGLTGSGEADPGAGTAEVVGLVLSLGSLVIGLVAAQLGILFVTAMVALVCREAALGRRATLGDAWAGTHGSRWRLIGLTLLIGLASAALTGLAIGIVVAVALLTGSVLASVGVGLVVLAGFVCLAVTLWVRLAYLASAILVLERTGVVTALRRGWALTAGHFWRTLGIGLLTVMVTGFAGGLLTTPISLVGNVATVVVPAQALVILALTQAVALVVQNAFVTPFVAAVTSLQYIDLRIRKEGYDVELMREAGLLPR